MTAAQLANFQSDPFDSLSLGVFFNNGYQVLSDAEFMHLTDSWKLFAVEHIDNPFSSKGSLKNDTSLGRF